MKANKEAKINRLWSELANLSNPTRLEAGIELSSLLMRQNEADDAIAIGLAVIDQAESLYVGILADHVANVALFLHESKRSQEALDILADTIARAKQEDDINGMLPCLVARGRIEQDLEQPIAALFTWQEAATLAEWVEDFAIAAELHTEVAKIADDYVDFNEAFQAAGKAVDAHRANHNFKGVCKAMYFVGRLAFENEHYAAAELHASSALEIAEFVGKPAYQSRCLTLLGQSLSKLGKHSEAIEVLDRASKVTAGKKLRALALEALEQLSLAHEAAGNLAEAANARSLVKSLARR
jgi:tetratricopeptide (TPR) repeat protein